MKWRLLLASILIACSFAPAVRGWDDSSLTPKERQEVFEQVWEELNYNFYDPTFKGVNWKDVHQKYLPQLETVKTDAEFYALLNRMAGELRDAHTRVLAPALLAQLKSQQRPSAGFRVEEVEGKPVVTSVVDDSDAARGGVEPGMIVLTIDGQPAVEKIAQVRKTVAPSSSVRLDETRVYASTFGGPAGTKLTIKLQRADSSTFETTLTRQLMPVAPKLTTRRLSSGATYIAFDQFTTEITKQFKAALPDARGLIIDLRENSGGSSQALYPLVSSFFNEKTLFLRDTTRNGMPLRDAPPPKVYVGGGESQLYSGPVVILVGPRSGSSAELFAAGMQEMRGAIVIGSQTCGCAVGINSQRRLKGGAVLEIGEVLWLTPSGKKIEGAGVTPDRVVVPTIADLQKRRDPLIEAAEKVLEEKSLRSRR